MKNCKLMSIPEYGKKTLDVVTQFARIDVDTLNLEMCDFYAIEGPLIEWSKICDRYPEFCRFLVSNEGRIVGYWLAAFLTDGVWDLVVNGKVGDSNITPRNIVDPFSGKDLNLYLIMFAVQEPYRSALNFRKLMSSFCSFTRSIKEKGIIIKNFGAVGATENGEKICRYLGLKKTIPHEIYPGYVWVSAGISR